MRLLLIFFMLEFISFGCSGAKTLTADILTASMTTAISSSLSCQDSTAVKADVKAKVDAWFELGEKSITSDLCKVAVASILPKLIQSTVPAAWKCTGQVPADLGVRICQFIP